MRAIKQKNEEYCKYVPSIESLVDKLLYNPLGKKIWLKKKNKGTFRRLAHGLHPLFKAFNGGDFSDYELFYIGQSHLDAAWLFPVLDTKFRAYKTIYQAIEHIKKYPWFFTYSQTSPQYYNWIKHYDRTLWLKVKKYVDAGRFEPVGGMWIEPTLDELWGECIVRQRLYGQHYYLREFGKISEVETLLDVFGFPHSLPQILKKSGAHTFWTTKCTWNDQNKWPIANFMWRGVDGTEIFTHHFKFQYMALLDLPTYKKMARFPKKSANQQILSSRNTNEEIESCLTKVDDDRVKTLGIFYGWGDGARGPHEAEINLHQTFAELGCGKFTDTHTYFEILKKEVGERYLIWDDEMYLEYHRGCKTTQNEIKHYNRKAELWAFASETLLTLLNLIQPDLPEEMDYHKPEMFEIWRKILFNQFHDILPGTSIPEVYNLAVKEQKESIADAQYIIKKLMSVLQAEDEEGLVYVYNPFSWIRSEYMIIDNKLCYLEDVPPLSINKYKIEDISVSLKEDGQIDESSDYLILENDNIKANISKEFGTLTSLFFKPLQMDLLTTGGTYKDQGSGLRVYKEDIVKYDAWNIDPNYAKKIVNVEIVGQPSIETLRGGIQCVSTIYKFLKSSASVKYLLYPNEDMVRIKIHTDIKDPKILVKFFVPLSYNSDYVTSEIPYAHIKRTRVPKSEMERAKWEANMQKWVDVSTQDYGLTILNDNRYGFNYTRKGVYITLTRTAKYPKPGFFSTFRLIPKKDLPKFTDIMEFNYDLGLLAHVGTESSIKSWLHGYNFNLPLQHTFYSSNPFEQTEDDKNDENDEKNEGVEIKGEATDKEKLTTEKIELKDKDKKNILNISMITNSSQNIIIGAIKPPEFVGEKLDTLVENNKWTWDKKVLYVRLIEQSGEENETKITLHPSLKVKSVEEVDLLEMNPSGAIKITKKSNSFDLFFHKFEIKTIKIILQNKSIY